ncbi:MAG: hypothetical protein A3B30_01280 [Candidatus Komeilibacteria bacterium RIFCSPLOWO2_01_FULL_52_15]|uniref:LiaI-LiaF-like transmembrane region domain-containing protein n=2 Tax=Candidatus Komeiliibacteriota TaxID=1817908 RepID=A0A1G2BR64_9BACT|nr:MAG: hypothetical protein A2677_01670 [Candidatus Komeilibacteria bacterium RIFCSPHIGHO2_01_FULL_52_14]OGY91601.1 MAG: hypothetical protein A3B30_01280 [Candidatus Komeilibacteria bacterium RIFCSPLOWO2_01_FULL_52_15]
MAFAMMVTLIGFLLLLDKLGIISSSVWGFFWPLLIICIGLSMMFNKLQHDHYFDECCFRGDHGNGRKHSHRKR